MRLLRALLVLLTVLCFAPLPAFANRVEDSIVSQLRAQGFTQIEVSRTLLGRARVRAQSQTLDREIIFNPVTGAILRDYTTERGRGGGGYGLVDPARGGDSAGAEQGGFHGDDGDGDSDGDGDGDGDGGDD